MPRIFNSAASLFALCVVAASPLSAQAQQGPAAAATSQASPYLAVAGESDVFEITSSQIALMRSQNAELRSFAQMMIADHTLTTNQALSAANTATVMAPPPVLGPQHRQQITELLSASGAAFDRLYWEQQLAAHQAALSLHSGYAQNGDQPPLRAVAAAAVPIIEVHLEHVRGQAGQT